MKIHKLFMVVLILAIASVILPQAALAEKEVKFGFPAPLSGPRAGWGESMLQGTELAIEDINAGGGILGHKVTLVKGDVAAGEPGTVLSVVRKLITRDKVDIMLTGAASTNLVEYEVMQESKMPYLLFAYAPAHEKLLGDNPGKFTYIHNCTSTYNQYKTQFPDVIEKAIKEGKFKPANRKVAIIKSENDYSLFCGNGLRDTFKQLGWDVVIDETIPFGGRFSEFAPIISKIRKEVPAIICYTDHTSSNAATFMLDFLQDPTPSIVYLQATPSYPDFKEIMKGRQSGVFWTYPDPTLGPKAPAYIEKFKAKWGKAPDPYGIYNYDVAMIAAEAMKKSGKPTDRDAVNKVLSDPNFSYDGISGKFMFGPDYLAKTGAGFIEFATKQEWEDKSNVVYPFAMSTVGFQLPPWYAKGLEKFGSK